MRTVHDELVELVRRKFRLEQEILVKMEEEIKPRREELKTIDNQMCRVALEDPAQAVMALPAEAG